MTTTNTNHPAGVAAILDAGPIDHMDLVEILSELGYAPAMGDPSIPGWLDRYFAIRGHHDGYLAITVPDRESELMLLVLTPSGVIISEARFDLTDVGLRMFVAAAETVAALEMLGGSR